MQLLHKGGMELQLHKKFLKMKIYIKNMVNYRCISVVRRELAKLGFHQVNIVMGEAEFFQNIKKTDFPQINTCLKLQGYEILDQKRSKMITQIKIIIAAQIHYSKEKIRINFSNLISQKLRQDYSLLNDLFSEIEGMTIDQYIVFQRIEKVKELLIYSDLTSNQIADFMNFSSVPHLTTQFKKLTGLSPNVFKALKETGKNHPNS